MAGRWRLIGAAGAAWWIEKLVTVEWSYAYCGFLDNGEAAAVHGFPLPYQQASIVTSATDLFIPGLYLVNLAAFAAGILLLLIPIASRFSASKARRSPLARTVAILLFGTAVAVEVMMLSVGVWRPISSFAHPPRYSELRPVALRVLGRPRNCTASPFWFGTRTEGRSLAGRRDAIRAIPMP